MRPGVVSISGLAVVLGLLAASGAQSPAPSSPNNGGSSPCEIEVNFVREGGTINDPSKVRTETPEECCQLCRADPRCASWTRDKRTKACAFKDSVVELRRNHHFDSGVVGGAPAAQNIPIDDRCIVEERVDYEGTDLREMKSADANECCRMCEEDLECFSWTRIRDNGRCFLKSGVPQRKDNSRTDGGTVF